MSVLAKASAGITAVALTLIGATAPVPAAQQLDTNGIQNAIGLTGKMMPGGVYRVSISRSDLHVTVDGVPLKTAFALGGYAVYEAAPKGTLVMGDLPLLESEVAAVQKSLVRTCIT